MVFMLSFLFKCYIWNSVWLYYVCIFIVFCGIIVFLWWLGDVKLMILLMLGMVVVVLIDFDD